MKKIVLLVMIVAMLVGCSTPEPVLLRNTIQVSWVGRDQTNGTIYIAAGDFVRLQATMRETWSDGSDRVSQAETSFEWSFSGDYKINPKQGGNQGQFYDIVSFPNLGKDNIVTVQFTACLLRNYRVCKTERFNLSTDVAVQ
jgi:hypothetical protein